MSLPLPTGTLNTLHRAQTSLNTSVRRLSTGLRINSAKDDPAGLQAATRLKSELTSIHSDRAADQRDYYAAMLADASYGGLSALLTQAQSLLLKSTAGPTPAAADRDAIQTQLDAVLQAVDRLSATVSLNGRSLLTGTTTLGHPGTPPSPSDPGGTPGTLLSLPRIDTQSLTIPRDATRASAVALSALADGSAPATTTIYDPPLNEPEYSLADLSSTGRLALAKDNPELAQKVLTAAVNKLNEARVNVGSFMRYTISSWGNVLDTTEEGLAAALSQIQDTDYPAETASAIRQQSLIQSSTALLAIQASRAQDVLSLIS